MQHSKNNKSPFVQQIIISGLKGMQIKNSEKGLRAKFARHKRPKQYEFANKRNSISVGDESTKMEEGQFCLKNNKKQTTNNKSQKKEQKSMYKNKVGRSETRKQTFKDFIRKIQMYNKNKIINEFELSHQQSKFPLQSQINIHNTQICIHAHNKIPTFQQLSLQMISNPKNQAKLFHKYAQDCPFKIASKQLGAKTSIGARIKDKSKQFVIHQSASRSLCNRMYKMSRTQQEIKVEVGSEEREFCVDQDLGLKYGEKQKRISTDISSFYVTNSKKQQKPQLNHVSLKLMQQLQVFQQKDTPLTRTEHRLKTIDSSKSFNQDKDMNKHKKLLQTKHSKIRIRFGSSLYNKNLWRFDIKSKQSLQKQLQSICTEDLITIKYNRNDRKPSLNSIFCQKKILEAQNAFIQKRRLIPTNGVDFREDHNNKTSKRFFSLTNSFKRHKTVQYEGKAERSKKGDRLNGWEISDDEIHHDKIQQFF